MNNSNSGESNGSEGGNSPRRRQSSTVFFGILPNLEDLHYRSQQAKDRFTRSCVNHVVASRGATDSSGSE